MDEVANNLERFFEKDGVWPKVEQEVASAADQRAPAGRSQAANGILDFKVVVPQPYPGVQYRKSKQLDDRYQRYAENGSTVRGQIEDNGEWLRISRDVFLPMRVGAVQILEPQSKKATKLVETAPHFWGCCGGPMGDDQNHSLK